VSLTRLAAHGTRAPEHLSYFAGQSIRFVSGAFNGLVGVVVEQTADDFLLVKLAEGVYARLDSKQIETMIRPT
jgi:hypothetical protein